MEPVERGEPLLGVDDVSVSFGGIQALSGITLALHAGEYLALVGTNGSGKTTLLNTIGGLYRPDSGSIQLGGDSLEGLRAYAVARRGVARTFQHTEAPPESTVLQCVMGGLQPRVTHWRTISYGLGIPFLRGDERGYRAVAAKVLSRVGLEDYSNMLVGSLPYGLAKRVDLARALASTPRLLLLDEPAAGLNEQERDELATVLLALREEQITLILVEHDMALVSRVCERAVVLIEGRKIYDGLTGEAMQDARVVTSLLGRRADDAAGPGATATVSDEVQP